MEIFAGFLIAVCIALTGVGAGVITAPILILFLHVPTGVAVGTALAYAAIVKLIVAPAQIVRKQVNYRVLGFMLLGGLPGVILGALLFRKAAHAGNWSLVYWALGGIIILSSGFHIYRYFSPTKADRVLADRAPWIAALMFPVGAEVGFSSSGAGALGTVILLSLTTLPASIVVGTDLVFGFAVAVIGSSIHFLDGTGDPALLMKLVIGGILGAIVGVSISPRIPQKQLRLALSLWLLFIGIEFCLKAAKL
ncbi:MAG: sulfite exporter TauE/SafE family protein [Terracidiphilus sp.]